MKRLLSIWVGAGLLLGLTRQAKADYIYTTLDVPGSSATQAYGINASGQIVGSYESGGTYYPGTQDSPTSPERQRRDPVAGAPGL